MSDIEKEVLLGLWKIHILHHAAKEPVVGHRMIRELRSHGYEISPGTLYPLLNRMEARGWLGCRVDPGGGVRTARKYTLTRTGRQALAVFRDAVAELYREVVLEKRKKVNSKERRSESQPVRR